MPFCFREGFLKQAARPVCLKIVGALLPIPRDAAWQRPLCELLYANMKTFLGLILWCILFVLCWPLAVLAVIVFPLVWLLSLPFRLVGVSIEAVLALFKAIIFLPARLLRGKA